MIIYLFHTHIYTEINIHNLYYYKITRYIRSLPHFTQFFVLLFMFYEMYSSLQNDNNKANKCQFYLFFFLTFIYITKLWF